MDVQIACLACSIDPVTTSLLVPIAQATIISAPILFRNQIRRGVNAVLERRPAVDSADVAPDERCATDAPTATEDPHAR